MTVSLFCFILIAFQSRSQDLLVQPYRMTLLQSKTSDRTNVRLVHNFPGFVQMRMVYSYFDGDRFMHKISTILLGYHKVWNLPAMPPAAANLRFLSFTIQYGAYTLQSREGTSQCILMKDGIVADSSSYIFTPNPLEGKLEKQTASK